MRYLLLVAWLFLPVLTYAYVPTFVSPEHVDDHPAAEEIGKQYNFFGELAGFPHTFLIPVKYDDTEVSITVLSPQNAKNPANLSGILVQKEQRGVSEVARLHYRDFQWESVMDRTGRDRYLAGGRFTGTLNKGEYLFEVSNGDNRGRYVVLILQGEAEPQSRRGYFSVLRDVAQIKSFLGKSPLHALESPYYLVPTLLILSFVGWYWYRSRKHNLYDA